MGEGFGGEDGIQHSTLAVVELPEPIRHPSGLSTGELNIQPVVQVKDMNLEVGGSYRYLKP